MASVSFEDVAKIYPDGTRAVSKLDLEIADGEFVVLVGPSVSGKTTALRMIAGQVEAMTMGDRVAVMRRGSWSRSILRNSSTTGPYLFVGGFISSPAMNLGVGQMRAPLAPGAPTSRGSPLRRGGL